MRKILRITVVVVTFVFILRSFSPVKIDEEAEFYISIIYFTLVIPLCTYEVIQVLKDDRINNTNVGKKRIIVLTILALALILSFLIF
jgi:hypothetical protein